MATTTKGLVSRGIGIDTTNYTTEGLFGRGLAAGNPGVAAIWTEQTVGSATWTEQTEGAATWTEQTEGAATWTTQ